MFTRKVWEQGVLGVLTALLVACVTQTPVETRSPVVEKSPVIAVPSPVPPSPEITKVAPQVLETRVVEETLEQVEITTSGTEAAILEAEQAAIAAASKLADPGGLELADEDW